MNKKRKVILLLVVMALVAVGASLFIALKPDAMQAYDYTTKQGQKYSLLYFSKAQTFSSEEFAKLTGRSVDDVPGPPTLVAYVKDDLGFALNITDAVGTPIPKTCTGKDDFAFAVGEFEVCKIVNEKINKTAALTAKVSHNSKHFIVIIAMHYNDKRILEDNDKEYIRRFNEFDILQYKSEITTILQSIRPL